MGPTKKPPICATHDQCVSMASANRDERISNEPRGHEYPTGSTPHRAVQRNGISLPRIDPMATPTR